jgi:hypothetical protein
MKRTKHNLSNYNLTTMDMGQLIPVQVQEVLPGDTMKMSTSALIRVSPMLAPIMHPVSVRLHHWFVPHRLVWDSWEDFITGGPDGQNTDTVPTITQDGTAKTILDHMGVPPVNATDVSALPVRAYNMVYNEFYRDQDLQPTERSEDNVTIANVAWRKDYFTAARPWPQKGPDLVLPIGDTAPIAWDGTTGTNYASIFSTEDDADVTLYDDVANTANRITTSAQLSNASPMYADLTNATGVSAIEFREFFALQRYAEARARYGSRYTEYLRYLGVKPSDARLQRPEYLGGGSGNISFSEVLTSYDDPSETSNIAGSLRGHGISAVKTKNCRRFFEEHGTVITLMSVVPKSIYTDGAHRMWLRQSKEDFYQKELQNIGQQKVKTGEVYLGATDPDAVFGYSNRYAEYSNTPSVVTSEFRDTLDFWHLGRKFDTEPVLNEDFIKCVPSKRIFAEQTQNSLWCMINNQVVSRRMVGKNMQSKLM